ncbi:C4-dicarboxylate ABC transporter permease [Spirochaetia bacterium]|nr:C4-dicarboxylate ABC transporter permease [Spirochaetia bacterium]
MKSIKNVIDTMLQWFCVLIVALMTFFVTYQVVTRYIFNKPSAVSETIARYLFVWLTIFGGAYVFGKRGHMNLVFIREKFSPKIQTVLEILSEFLIAVFAILIMIYGGRIYTVKQFVQIDPSLMFPMAWIYGCLPVGGVLVLFYSIYNELELFKKLKA